MPGSGPGPEELDALLRRIVRRTAKVLAGFEDGETEEDRSPRGGGGVRGGEPGGDCGGRDGRSCSGAPGGSHGPHPPDPVLAVVVLRDLAW